MTLHNASRFELNRDLRHAAWHTLKSRARPSWLLVVPWMIDRETEEAARITEHLGEVRTRNDGRFQWYKHASKHMSVWNATAAEGTVPTLHAALTRLERDLPTPVAHYGAGCVALTLTNRDPSKSTCLEFLAPDTPGGADAGSRFARAAYEHLPRSTGWFHQGGVKPDQSPSNWHLFEFWNWERDPQAVMLACQKVADVTGCTLQTHIN